MELTLNQTIDGIAYADLDGFIQFTNVAWANMHGYYPTELVGRHLSIFHSEAQVKNQVIPFNEIVIAQGYNSGEVGHIHRDGGVIPTLMSVTLVVHEDQGPLGLVAVARDITEQKEREQALGMALAKAEELRKKAEQATLAKSEFLANISHEIRTPMNGVIGMTGLLTDTMLDSDQEELVATIRSSGKNLMDIINKVLDFSKIEAGKVELEGEVYGIRRCLEDVLAIFKATATSKGVALDLEIGAAADIVVFGDVGCLRQILVNLVGNALKFTLKGAVVLRVESREISESKTRMEFSVRDTGIGISPEKQAGVFIPFGQADSSFSRDFEGTGLGLSISAQLVELMGGYLAVYSRLGEGATFGFSLPMEISALDERDQITLPEEEDDSLLIPFTESGQEARFYRVLVVEDNSVNQKVVTRLLTKFGIKSEVAANGEEALSALAMIDFDAVLMDCQMPVMDGYEATKKIRMGSGVRNPKIAIIALTAHSRPEDRQAALDMGMDDYLQKPLNVCKLRKTLRHWLGSGS